MNIEYMKEIAYDEIRKVMKHHFDIRFCPKCKFHTQMLRFSVTPETEEGEHKTKYRCLNCLEVFTEELVKEE